MNFISLAKLHPGSRVAILSPSAGLPAIFPHVFEQGLDRIKSIFKLIPVEYPTTRQMNAPLQDRARDVMAAFCDDSIEGIITSIGGNDQIRLLRFLDAEKIKKNPKVFMGYSDNTHLHTYLWNLGIPSYYGGAVMLQFAMQGGMHALSQRSIENALFKSGRIRLEVSTEFTDFDLPWEDPALLKQSRPVEPNEGWYWDGEKQASGILWGGCLESIQYQLLLGRYFPEKDRLKNVVLCLETSEEMPSPETISRFLIALGERGILANCAGLFVGRPKTQFRPPHPSPQDRQLTRRMQREIILSTFRDFNAKAPLVMNMDFGHTEPQLILPLGKMVHIDPALKIIDAEY
jgi:muramoyltetrapeptide carboxypeptidase LdcA involved in peptidoglycan recycling